MTALKSITDEQLLFAPIDLSERDQWVLWRRERDTKVPYQVNGKRASSTGPATWDEYTVVFDAWRRYPAITPV